MKSILIAMAAVATGVFAAPAGAQAQDQANTNVNVVTLDGLISFGQARGYTTRQAGDGSVPAVEMRTPEGLIFYAIGNACEADTCTGLKLLGRHEPEGRVTVAQINGFNRDIPPVKVWYNDNVMAMERYLILNGGVSRANLAYEVDTFITIMSVLVERANEAARANAQ